MILAIVCGIAVGALGFVPLVYGMNLARKATATSNLGPAGALLLGVLISIVILGGGAAVCLLAFRSVVMPFALAEAISLCVVAIGYGIWRTVRK